MDFTYRVPEFNGDLVYKFRKIIGKMIFLFVIKKLVIT